MTKIKIKSIILKHKKFRSIKIWKEHINPRKDKEVKFTDLEKECQQKTAETFLKEEDKKVAINFLHNKEKKLDYRLKKQFDLVFNKGTRIYSKSLTMIYLKSNSLKFGISVSKKHGKAVVRNRIKRLIRAVLVKYRTRINGLYFIIILPKINNLYNFDEFNRDIEFLLKKGKFIND